MKTLPRTQFGNPILRAKAEAVPPQFVKTAVFKRLVREMFHTMHRAEGVGLAAPQIGQPIQLAVIQLKGERLRRVVLNPKVLWHSQQTELDWEGCLSFPPARGQAKRWKAIKVSYMDEKGRKVIERHDGYAARVFQHEIDHLNGILFVDRMPDMRSLMSHQEFMRRVVR